MPIIALIRAIPKILPYIHDLVALIEALDYRIDSEAEGEVSPKEKEKLKKENMEKLQKAIKDNDGKAYSDIINSL